MLSMFYDLMPWNGMEERSSTANKCECVIIQMMLWNSIFGSFVVMCVHVYTVYISKHMNFKWMEIMR